ncbi:MAG: hypothetical protein H6581_12890 [Bacteroidia bacterium]|nr:hypothetical protein [Bacteroidia bacterium]
MNSRRRILTLASLVLLFMVGFFYLMRFSDSSETSFFPNFSTYYTNDHGTHALYAFLEGEKDFEVRKNYLPLDKTDENSLENFVFIAPEEGFAQDEIDRLNDLIFDGSIAIVCVRNYNNFLEDWGVYTPETGHKDAYEDGILDLGPALPDPVWYGMELPRYLRRESFSEHTLSSINQDFAYHFSSDTLPIRPIFQTAEGETHVGYFSYGRGGIYLVSNPHPFTNAGLRFPSNVTLVTTLFNQVRQQNPETFVFDEYHHGFHMESVATPISIPQVRYMVWGILLTFALTIWSFGRRDRKPVPILREPRRSISEFVTSMATIYHRKGGIPYLYRDVVNRFGARLRRSLGLSARGLNDPKVLYPAAARKWGNPEAEKLKIIMKNLASNQSENPEFLAVAVEIRKFSIRNKLDIHV